MNRATMRPVFTSFRIIESFLYASLALLASHFATGYMGTARSRLAAVCNVAVIKSGPMGAPLKNRCENI